MSAVVKTYYTVSSPSSTWTIEHGLGVMPIVNILVEVDGEKVPAFPLSMTHNNSLTTTTITWSVARSGEVHVLY